MPGKSGKITVDLRINIVYRLLLKGIDPVDIVQYCSKKTEWGVGDRQIYKYIEKAYERLEENSKFVQTRELGRSLSRLHNLYSQSMAIQDYKTALAVQKEINTLLGLEAPKKLNVEGALTIEQLESLAS